MKIFGADGKAVSELSLPPVFASILRKDIITKAVVAQQSHRFQPQGRNPMAGRGTTAEAFVGGKGISRSARLGGHGALFGTAALSPGRIGGGVGFSPVAFKHPPQT